MRTTNAFNNMNLPRNIFNEVFVNGLLPNDIHTYILEKNKVYVVVVEVIIMISVICVVMV